MAELVDSVARRYAVLRPHLNEFQRRLWLGAEAAELGPGGVAVVAKATGVATDTVRRGRKEADDGGAPGSGRSRVAGGGRKRAEAHDGELAAAFDLLIDPVTRGDPMSPLRWTSKSIRALTAGLRGSGHRVSDFVVRRLLAEGGYSLQANAKTIEGNQHVDRDAQFAHLAAQAQAHMASGDPVISVDALVDAHHAATAALKKRHSGVRVGWSVANQVVQAVSGGEAIADEYREALEDQFLRASRGNDFIGVQSYTRTVFGPDGLIKPGDHVHKTLTGWEYFPGALGEAIRHTREIVGDVPILVTENGIATADDEERIAYTSGALEGMALAMADGANVRGYLHWSALDNYEWGNYTPTFGLIAVDRTTFVRTPKPSAAWLGDWARQGTLPIR